MFPKPGDTVERVGVEFVIGMSRGSVWFTGGCTRREGEPGECPGEVGDGKKCGRHARYLSPDIMSIYIEGWGSSGVMVVPVGDSFTYW